MMRYIGVDGCCSGWFWVGLSDRSDWRTGICKSAKALGAVAAASRVTLIDVPIGLRDAGCEERLCDKVARRALGPRASSVFPAPARATLAAEDYTQAKGINREVLGRGLSLQSWAITPKIREIDDLLRSPGGLRNLVREVHPEVCFWGLNGKRPMAHNKKKRAGREERVERMTKILPETSSIIACVARIYHRRDVAWDDILDALVAAITAKLGAGRLQTLPAKPATDAFGLPMEMVFTELS
ncbi:MAG: DUF429 domain-containing protein [Gammaproteobacteria bacterium]|nr:DUF429 domain-containing protein [Gammaproteobacteria bacterium]